ncbi:hypothetical protein [Chakrabartyella piscis]|uniref:hypothetical protein n=1 Tax=Chakrabartyella piscis TaxID=2918914 RepID=UPI002958B4ED|nr:hypothetical protein [Chakrabartyella piscis]
MLIHITKYGVVDWHNLCISEHGAESLCTNEYTLWITDTQLPEVEDDFTLDDVVIHYSTEDGLYYEYPEDYDPLYTDTQLIMQELTNLELLILEGGLS